MAEVLNNEFSVFACDQLSRGTTYFNYYKTQKSNVYDSIMTREIHDQGIIFKVLRIRWTKDFLKCVFWSQSCNYKSVIIFM